MKNRVIVLMTICVWYIMCGSSLPVHTVRYPLCLVSLLASLLTKPTVSALVVASMRRTSSRAERLSVFVVWIRVWTWVWI